LIEADSSSGNDTDPIIVEDPTSGSESESEDDEKFELQQRSASMPYPSQSFMCIKGMVDGIRDELVEGKEGEDDSSVLRRIVVECKHRMCVLLAYPRLSECIQAVVYCLMYDAEAADIIQVMRTSKNHANNRQGHTTATTTNKVDGKQVKQTQNDTKPKSVKAEGKRKNQSPSESLSKGGPLSNRLITDCFIVKTRQNEKGNGTNNELDGLTTGDSDQSEKITPDDRAREEKKDDHLEAPVEPNKVDETSSITNMEIEVNRVSLNDHFGHLSNWKGVILPRLCQWTESVYQIRQSDDLRYRLLSLMAQVQTVEDSGRRRGHLLALWELVFEHCPFMRESKANECLRRELSSSEW
jgi:hypothetical protein